MVVLGEIVGDKVRIEECVVAGERIVAVGVSYLSEGMKVRLYSGE